MDNFTDYHIHQVGRVGSEIIEFLHRLGLDVICHVDVWLHGLVVAMASPLHDNFCRNTQ